MERSGLRLEAGWTKNREEGFQPLPRGLIERLKASVESGEPARLYREGLLRGGSRREVPSTTLVYLPGRPAKVMSKDLEAAGIPVQAPGGKLDFHALRTAFVNLVFEFGQVSGKEAQDLARHSTPNLTFNVYGRSREGRLVEAMERVAQAVLPVERVPGEYRQAVGAELENATLSETKGSASFQLAPSTGVHPGPALLDPDQRLGWTPAQPRDPADRRRISFPPAPWRYSCPGPHWSGCCCWS